VNFLCRDSILAAPLALDLALLTDLAQRRQLRGAQEWLSLFFKSPISRNGDPVHDLFAQKTNFDEALRSLRPAAAEKIALKIVEPPAAVAARRSRPSKALGSDYRSS
jgi:myo-inositol-1-phosphate synthase